MKAMRARSLFLAFLLLASAFSCAAYAANPAYLLQYEKQYVILDSGQELERFQIYPNDNESVVWNTVWPTPSVREMTEGDSVNYVTPTAEFTLILTEIREGYVIVELSIKQGDVTIADPEAPPNNVVVITDPLHQPVSQEDITSAKLEQLEEQIAELNATIAQLRQQIKQLQETSSTGGLTADDVNKIVDPKIKQLQSDINNLQAQIQTLTQALAEIKKQTEKSKIWNDPVLQQLIGSDPKMVLLMTLFDPNATEEEKQQALTAYLVQQEKAKKRIIIYVVLSLTVVASIVGVIAWLKLRRERMSPYRLPRPQV